jgi:hypothetical protein
MGLWFNWKYEIWQAALAAGDETMMSLQYEFRSYGEDAVGQEAVEFGTYRSDSSARHDAGKMAVKINGPVDVARAGGAEWNERYISTAIPSEHHRTGYQFERLS